MRVWLVSLSTVVLNSRDHQKNVWLPKYMRLENNLLKFTMQKTNLYNTNNAITSFKVPKCC